MRMIVTRACSMLAGCVLAFCLVLQTAGSGHAAKVAEATTRGGIGFRMVEEHRVPLVALRFSFDGGAAQDPTGKDGATSLMVDAMLEGAGGLEAAALKEAIAGLGMRLSLVAGRDAIHGSVEIVSSRLEAAAQLLGAILASPAFDAAGLEPLKQRRITSIEYENQSPAVLARQQWYAAAFPDHPYGRPVDGSRETIGRLARSDLLAQHKRLLARDTLKVVVVGDATPALAGTVLDRIFGSLPARASLSEVTGRAPRSEANPVASSKPAALTAAMFGLPGLAAGDPEYPSLRVLNHILGSGDFDSLLMSEIRVKRGLAYSADTRLQSDQGSPLLIGRFSTRNGSMTEALAVLRDVLARTAAEGPTTEQFENARDFVAGSALLDTDTSARLAGALLDAWRAGEGVDALALRSVGVSAVTLDDVKRVARRVLATDRMLVSVVGPAD